MSVLYLIPVPIGKRKENHVLPEHTLGVVRRLNSFVVENIRHAQSFLQWIGHPKPLHELDFRVLNKKTPDHEVYSFLERLKQADTGLFSEAGAPGVADPGSRLVRTAHDNGIRVVPLTGPSSILLALMASGLNGQQFAFHGYLPVDDRKRKEKIRELERESATRNLTQIFMEAPFRNDRMVQSILETCQPETRFCVACELTMPGEVIVSTRIHQWNSEDRPGIQGKPAIFLIHAG